VKAVTREVTGSATALGSIPDAEAWLRMLIFFGPFLDLFLVFWVWGRGG